MSFFDSQNPGIGGLDELTLAEEVFLTTFAGLSYSNGDVLTISGGVLDWLPPAGGTSVAGSDTQVQFNDGGVMGASQYFAYVEDIGALSSELNIGQVGGSTTIQTPHDNVGSSDGGSLGIWTGRGGLSGGNGGNITIQSGEGSAGTASGGGITFSGGNGADSGNGGAFELVGGNGGPTDGHGGGFAISGGNAVNASGNGGTIVIGGGTATGSGTQGKILLASGGSSVYANLITTSLSGSDKDFTFPNASGTLALTSDIITAHSGLTGLTSGDPHTQYLLLAGRSGGQTATGGTAASNNLVLRSTSHGTKGQVYFDETTNTSSSSTGAVRLAGGLGVAKRIYTDSFINARNLRVFHDVGGGATAVLNFNQNVDNGSYICTSYGTAGTQNFNLNNSFNSGPVPYADISLVTQFTDAPLQVTTVNNRDNGTLMIGGASVYSNGAGTTADTATVDLDYNSGGGVVIGSAYVNNDGAYDSTSTITNQGGSAVMIGSCGSTSLFGGGLGGNTASATLSGGGAVTLASVNISACTTTTAYTSNSANGGLLQGYVNPTSAVGITAYMEAGGTGGASALGMVTRGYMSSANQGTSVSGYVGGTADTAALVASGIGSGTRGRAVGSGKLTSSGNGSYTSGNISSTASGTNSGAGSFLCMNGASSAVVTLSAAGSIAVLRANGTGTATISGATGGNGAFGDVGTAGINATGAKNCFQFGNGSNSTTDATQIGVGVLLSGLTTVSSVFSNNLTLMTGTTSYAPLNIPSGTAKTTPISGDIEHVTDDFFATIATGAARKAFILDDGTRLTATRVPFATTNGRLTDDADMTFTGGDTLNVAKIVVGGGASVAKLDHGTYTPTLTNTTNIDASTARLCTWMRVGNTVTVAGQFDIDPTTTLTATLLGISLPVASALTTAYQLGGTANATGIVSMSAGIEADATNDRASVKFIATDITNQTMAFTFTYQVL